MVDTLASDPNKLMDALLKGEDVPGATKEVADTQEQSTEEEIPNSALEEWEKTPEEDDSKKEEETEELAKNEESDTPEKAVTKKVIPRKELEHKAKSYHNGMRKFQRERDAALAKVKEAEEKNVEHEALWNKVERAAGEQDFNQLMKIMTAGKMDFDTYLETRLEKSRLREDATEEELEKMDLQEKLTSLETKLSRQQEEMDDKLGKVKEDREVSEIKSLEAKIHPAFDRYRFHGKLGDKDAEHRLDRMLWTDTLTALEDYDEITPELVEKEFKTTAQFLGNVIEKQVETNTKKVSKTRKRNAKEAAQVQQVRGYVGNDLKKEASTNIKSGNLVDILKGWDKYGKLF